MRVRSNLEARGVTRVVEVDVDAGIYPLQGARAFWTFVYPSAHLSRADSRLRKVPAAPTTSEEQLQTGDVATGSI
jgi:hypothetical protein